MVDKKYYRDLIVDEENSEVFIVGLCYDEGCSCGKGAALAPVVIRELSQYLPPFTKDGNDLRAIALGDGGDYQCASLDEISQITRPFFLKDRFLVFLGGDHSVSIPLQAHFYERAIKRGKIPAIIHIDAHPDICDEYNGSRFSHACPNRRALELGIKTENLVLIGIRGFEAQEVAYFNEHPEIKIYSASMINDLGWEKMSEEITSKFDDRYEIYLSYDIDANDPSFAPGTGTPEAFGIMAPVLLKMITNIVKKLNVTVFDIVEVSPPLDNNNITSWLAIKTLYEVFYELINKRNK